MIALVDIDVLARNWWAIALRGVAAVLFGLLTLVAPGISLAALVLVFGVYALTDGVLAIVTAIRRRGAGDRWWMLFFEGIVGLAAGLITFARPGLTALALLYLVAWWALVTGVFEIAAAVRLRRVISHEWLLALSGVASITLGVLLILFPGAAALGLVLWIGAYAFVSGTLLVALGLRLRPARRFHSPAQPASGVA